MEHHRQQRRHRHGRRHRSLSRVTLAIATMEDIQVNTSQMIRIYKSELQVTPPNSSVLYAWTRCVHRKHCSSYSCASPQRKSITFSSVITYPPTCTRTPVRDTRTPPALRPYILWWVCKSFDHQSSTSMCHLSQEHACARRWFHEECTLGADHWRAGTNGNC
jgi:hypothetical protein